MREAFTCLQWRKRAHRNRLWRLRLRISAIWRKTPLPSPCSVQSEFSFAARFLRAHRHYARRIHLSCISKSICKLRCAAQKRGFACASDYLVHKICFKLLKQIFVSLRGNPSGFPLIARRNKATEGRRRAMFAAKPSYTCCSLSPKISHRYARCDFRGTPLFFKGTPKYARRFHPFRKPFGKWREKGKSVVLPFSSNSFTRGAKARFCLRE